MSAISDHVPQPADAAPLHAVQFYEREDDLFPAVAEFVTAGLRAGEAIVIIATPEHREKFRADVQAHGIDVDLAIRSAQLTLIDAREALTTFMVDGAPDGARFVEVIGGELEKSAKIWPGRTRAFGEMVNLLWQDGQAEAAIRLEELWNDLIAKRGFALLCAYSMGNFYRQTASACFADVCKAHDDIQVARPGAQGLEVELEHRKQLERALRDALNARREAERDLRDFVDNAPVGLHWVGPDGTILWANKAELEFLGYPREEYIGRNIRDFYVDKQQIEDILARLTAHEQLNDCEVRMRAKDGSVKHALVTSNVRFENGKFVHTRCFTRDVTDKRRAEEKFKRLIDSNIISVYTRTGEGTVVEANDSYLRLCGYDRDDLKAGRIRWMDLTPPEYIARDRAAMADLRTRGESAPYEKECIRKDGTRVPVLIGAVRVDDNLQIGYALDLTERKTSERDATFLAEAGEILARNLDANALLRDIASLFVPRFADYCFVDLRREQGFERVAAAGDEPHKVNDGRSLTVPLTARGATLGLIGFVGSASRRPFDKRDLALAQEVARRAAMAIDNARLYEAAQNANRAKDEFLATLSHELRTPMTAILGWSRFLQISNVDQETLANAIDAISRAAVSQAQLIDDILDMSRIISGKLRLDMQMVDLAAVVHAAADTVKPTMIAKQITLNVQTGSNSGMLWGDPNRLQQAVWNLLTNAAKFTPAGGTVSIEVKRYATKASIVVRDSGQGIEPDFLPHVFERFRQAESTSTRAHGGLGLGLAIVRYIVEMHGGRVSAWSEGTGRGATFTIDLPAAARVETAASTIAARDHYCDLSGARVMFVDDQAETRTFVRAVLEYCGAQVKDFSSAAEAMEAVRDWTPDVVLTDIAMPHEDGHALARRLAEHDWAGKDAPPVVALTAFGRKSYDARFVEHLSKPIDPFALAHAVKRVLGR